MHKILTFFKSIRRRFCDKVKLKKLNREGIEIIYPIWCSNYENLVATAPCYIGENAWLSLRGKLFIGAGTIVGPRLKVHTSNHRYEGLMLPYDDIYEVKDVHIGENCWVGADVSIMPGVNIGEGVVIAACACVTKNIPPYSVIGGVPAKVIKNRDIEKYKQLKNAGEIYLTKKRNGTTIIDENQRCVYVENNKKNIQ